MAPSPGGVAMRELLPMLRRVGCRNRVLGLDIVEIAPSADFANGLSCINAGRTIYQHARRVFWCARRASS